MSREVGGCLLGPSPPTAASPSDRPAVLLLHPVPSCCLAEAASQPAERKESCASRQEIEPSGQSPVTFYIKGEKAQSGCGVQCVSLRLGEQVQPARRGRAHSLESPASRGAFSPYQSCLATSVEHLLRPGTRLVPLNPEELPAQRADGEVNNP